ncbi:hypothetical protein [Endozoicomonas ascidiicola]|uniref:hypothetical protein n=1 Tax=Endozoicomonas ascidiicola TaxID=1698521 RepID=UPI00082C8623|nr:hypothetical protein [Endozoicomonas ascidiicola]
MSNVFIFTGKSIEEVDFMEDCYLQLILIQYSIKSVSENIGRLEVELENNQESISDTTKTQWINDLKTLRTIQAFLSEWLYQLNKHCPNP